MSKNLMDNGGLPCNKRSAFFSFQTTAAPSPLLGTYQSEETNPKGMVRLSFFEVRTFDE